MVFKKHTGITFTIIGILLPFFGSVCLASASKQQMFFSGAVPSSEKSITFQKNDSPSSKSMVKQDVDFIHRLKNDRFLYRKFPNIDGSLSSLISHQESSFLQFELIPRPAYYNYLFMFKPF